jgi:Protein of unknown function (DUF4012)
VRPASHESREDEPADRAERLRGGRRRLATRRLSFRRPGRRGWILLVLLALVLVVVVLALLALPLLSAHKEAKSAQTQITEAKAALSARDFKSARQHVKAARSEVDAADGHANGIGSDVWSAVPVAGGAVDDARNLIDALSQATTVAQIGTSVYPMVMGSRKDPGLVNGNQINLDILKRVVAATVKIGPHLNRAVSDLNDVSGSTPFVGGSVASARDSALTQLTSVKSSYDKTVPLLRSVPAIVGADGPRSYLVALLNPAELRYSGGAPLTMMVLNFAADGHFTPSGPVTSDSLIALGPYEHWKPVAGNTFHRTPQLRVTSSTFSPWWSASGEELLRGFHQAYPQPLSGVIAIDLQALANLFSVTGPVDLGLKGVPPISSTNLVKILAGSYDRFGTYQRHVLNAKLISAFQQKFFASGDVSKAAQSLLDSAPGRHFATYFRDRKVQHQFSTLGLTGDLASTPNDYLGLFTQNTNGSKTDYWQRRHVVSNVHLNPDGSADVHLKVAVHNGAPVYNGRVPDPKMGYYTRYLGTALGVFLPTGAKVEKTTVNRHPFTPNVITPTVKGVYNRTYFERQMLIDAKGTRVVRVSYHVPHAAAMTSDGGLMYRLDVDPQDTVIPETMQVNVTWPTGYGPLTLPSGWSSVSAQKATYTNPAVNEALTFEIPLSKG